MAYTFDGVAKTITLTAQTTMSVRDVYSRWVDWVITSDNTKFLPAFATLGGDSIDPGTGTSVPIYAFLINGWRIRPQESSHTLTVNDGILLVQGGGDPFLSTLGNYNVRVNYQQPVQAITVSTGGGGGASVTDIVNGVLAALIEPGTTLQQSLRLSNSVLGGKVSGVGSGIERFRNLADSKDRVISVTDDNGNRASVTRDLS
jgi:hypothetical protein